MKRKIFITAGLILLLGAMVFMARDLFRPASSPVVVPDQVDSLKTGDAKLLYRPLFSIAPEMEVTGIAASGNGILICGENRVVMLDSRGKQLSSFSVTGTPGCISADDEGNIYLGMKDHLLVLSHSGKERMKWKSGDTSTVITSVAAKGNHVVVADAGLRTLYLLDRQGKMIRRIGEEDPAEKIPGFIIPSPYFDVFMITDDSLWVVNPGRHELEKFSVKGELTRKWGEAGMTPDAFCGCCNPSHFTMLSDGSFVTSEKGIPRVKLYSAEGEFMGMVALPGEFEDETRGIDMAADVNDRIWVVDPVKKKITVYVRS